MLADFTIVETNFSLWKIRFLSEPFEYEALSYYLDTKFREGVESKLVKDFIDVKAELDNLIKEVEVINQAHQKSLATPDLKNTDKHAVL